MKRKTKTHGQFDLLFSDYHIHIEGAQVIKKDLKKIFYSAAHFMKENKDARLRLMEMTNQSLEQITRQYFISDRNEEAEAFNFQAFLAKLYCTKVILSSEYKLIEEFIFKVLDNYFKKHNRIRLSITPSIPYDFPHLNHKKWSMSIYKGINRSLKKYKNSHVHLVIETKRQHLDTYDERSRTYVYEQNLEFLKILKDKKNSNLKFSISVCDDESLYPISEPSRLAGFENYIKAIKVFRGIALSIHMLESKTQLEALPINLKQKFKNNLLYDFERIVEILDKNKVNKYSFIHLGFIFQGAEYNPKKRTITDTQKIKLGLQLINKIIKNIDKITVCPSSNSYLNNPFLLDYPEIMHMLLEDKLKVTIGTDDPGPFKVRDIEEEFSKLKNKIQNSYPNGIKFNNQVLNLDSLIDKVFAKLHINSRDR